MEYESDCDTICTWYAQYGYQRLGTRTGGVGNLRTIGDHPNYSIVDASQNSENTPGDLNRFTVSHTLF